MNSELVSRLENRAARRSPRLLAVHALGPLTMFAGVVWGISQPYRLVFLHRAGHGFYDWLVEPPLLAVAVGVLYATVIAPGIVDDLRSRR